MPQSLSYVYVHIVFSTKHRQPLIDESIEHELWAYLGGICKELECYPIQVGGLPDHVHVCCQLSKKITSIKLMEEIKKSSSKWMKTKGPKYSQFYWQDGYGEFSVNPAELKVVETYIKDQRKEHDKKNMTFQSEFLKFVKKYGVPYDERYMWE